MTLIISGDITLRRTWQPMDPDAAAYITAVETADGQALEEPVKIAIDNFVLGCKADGIWDAIKASCILAGARTLNGALVPLVGAAPTNFNFVAGDYNRKTGLVGDGSTKYLNSNRNNNADPQNSRHLSIFVSSVSTVEPFAILMGTTNVTGRTTLLSTPGFLVEGRICTNTGASTAQALAMGFLGAARENLTTVKIRNMNSSFLLNAGSNTPASAPIGVFGGGFGEAKTNPRLAFYSIGEALDLAKLDGRVTDLINKFAEVIP